MSSQPEKPRVEGISEAEPSAITYENPKFEDDSRAVFQEIDQEEERKIVKKIDMVVMPILSIVYLFQYLDKSSINYASVFGLRQDLNLTGEQFSWVVSLFYFGQLISEYPAAYLLSRLPIIPFVGSTIVAWGAVEMCLGATTSFHGIAVARFFLGFTEGCVSPAFVIITSNFYRRREHPMRVASWVSMNGISQMVGALLMYGIWHAKMAIASWRGMFLIAGGATVCCGIIFLLMMPRDTSSAWFLNERERQLATHRLAIDRATRDRSEFSRDQMYEALKSPMTWMYALMALGITPPTPILKFSSIVINGFGFSKFQTMLVGLPSGAICFIAVWASALIPRFVPDSRLYGGLFLAFIPLLGSALIAGLPAEGYEWGIVAGTWLAGTGSALIATSASLMASNVKGNTKKSVVSTLFFISYCIGCIIGPQAWMEEDAPRYAKGCYLSIASWILLIFVLVSYLVVVRAKNKSRDRRAAEGDARYDASQGVAGGYQVGVSVDSDITDVQDKAFRYRL